MLTAGTRLIRPRIRVIRPVAWRFARVAGDLPELPSFLSVSQNTDRLLMPEAGGDVLIGSKGTVPFLLCPQKYIPSETVPRAVFSYVRKEVPGADMQSLFDRSPFFALQSQDLCPGKSFINAYLSPNKVEPDFVWEYVEELSQYLGAYPFVSAALRYGEVEKTGFMWSSMPDRCLEMLSDIQRTQRTPRLNAHRSIYLEPFLDCLKWCFEDGRVDELRFAPFET